MRAPGKKQVRSELTQLHDRSKGIFFDYFDGCVVVGTRAGTPETLMHLYYARDDEQMRNAEDSILALAQKIIEKRKAKRGK